MLNVGRLDWREGEGVRGGGGGGSYEVVVYLVLGIWDEGNDGRKVW